MDYEIKLTPSEQRRELNFVADMLQDAIVKVQRKRGLRDSERAMNIAALKTKQVAVYMAIDTIDSKL